MDKRAKLVSNLSETKYPCLTDYDEIFKWVKFAPGVDPYAIDPVFLGRHAAMCKFLGIVDYVISGTRSLVKQIQLYKADGGYQLPNGEWTGGTGYVAKPGKSLHNFAMAIDSANEKIKAIEKDASFAMQEILSKFGLCKPMTKGNKSKVLESWHIQPVETKNLTVEQRAALAPKPVGAAVTPPAPKTPDTVKLGDKGEDVRMLQLKLIKKGYKLTADGDFGEKTKAAVIAFQKANKLTADGIVGPQTWSKLG